jgi:hypothetical protein
MPGSSDGTRIGIMITSRNTPLKRMALRFIA